MIKLKSLIKENNGDEEIIRTARRMYWQFIALALSGHQREADIFYRRSDQYINFMAKLIRNRFGPSHGTTIYRGILLDPADVHNGVVKGWDEITYVSFTEDKNIALAFADTENDMGGVVMHRYPHYKGYLITKDYDVNLLLFHHTWLEAANMLPVWRQQFGDDADITLKQKEVTLKPERQYEVEPVEPGISGAFEVGR